MLWSVLSGAVSAAVVISVIADSGVRGVGGAGFPTGKKLDLVAAQTGSVKYAICNADES